jgi:hypothetical protein
MTVYLTKVWGFGAPEGPLQFGQQGWRDRARRVLKDGDTVVLVGTLGEKTKQEDRGRVLGIMEPSREPVLWTDFDLQPSEQEFDEEGNYRWPYGLLNRRAWVLPDKPLLSDISSRQFSMDAAAGIVPLTDEEAARISQFRREEIGLLSCVRGQARLEGEERARRRGAPPPTTTRRGIMHMRRAPAYTYAMAIEGADRPSIKIGWAFDFHIRQQEFELASLPALGGLRYRPVLHQLWDTAMQAYRMEQELLKQFDELRHPSNREVLHGLLEADLQPTWRETFQRLQRQHRAIAA